jgi:REP element-mobilizing transposase RayT
MNDQALARSRGYLMHVDEPGATQFITYRLADSLPSETYRRWTEELQSMPRLERAKEISSRVEKHLDSGLGSCTLSNPVAARIVQENLFHHEGTKYLLHAWAIMPNHVHILLTLFPGRSLSQVMHSMKSYTSHEISDRLGLHGQLWQPEYYDRLIRDQEHFNRVAKYIEWNPVKAKLCVTPENWPYSSANEVNRKRLVSTRAGRPG